VVGGAAGGVGDVADDMTRVHRAFPLVAVLLVMFEAAGFPPSVIKNQDRSSGWPLNSMAPSVRSKALSRGST
jgi:hypothetical protein